MPIQVVLLLKNWYPGLFLFPHEQKFPPLSYVIGEMRFLTYAHLFIISSRNYLDQQSNSTMGRPDWR